MCETSAEFASLFRTSLNSYFILFRIFKRMITCPVSVLATLTVIFCPDAPRDAKRRKMMASTAEEGGLRTFTQHLTYYRFSSEAPTWLWPGVFTNEIREITALDWSHFNLQGNLTWETLPETMRDINLENNWLRGSVRFENLPAMLQYLTVASNRLSGPIDLTNLPLALKSLIVVDNMFSSNIALDRLPPSLEELNLGRNRLYGTLNFTSLPKSLRRLELHRNSFSGEIDLQRLPENMNRLKLYNNDLCGQLSFTQLPSKLQVLYLEGNVFSGFSRPPPQGTNALFVNDTVIYV